MRLPDDVSKALIEEVPERRLCRNCGHERQFHIRRKCPFSFSTWKAGDKMFMFKEAEMRKAALEEEDKEERKYVRDDE